MSLAMRLREVRAEVRAVAEAKGATADATARDLDAIVAALEAGAPNDASASASCRLTSEAVFDVIERRGLAATVRELRIVHDWTLAGVAAHAAELTPAHIEAARTAERLRFILTNARILVAEIDRDLRIQWIYDPRPLPDGLEMIGRNMREVGEPALGDQLAKVVERIIQSGAGERVEFSPPGENPTHMLGSFEPKLDSTGRVSGVLVATTNVTELKEAGLALEREAAIREQMIAVLAHDLRNPLSSVLALARLYGQKDDVPEDARRALSRIDHASLRMVELINMLLDFSAARMGGALSVARKLGDLHDVVRAAVDELRGASPERDIQLRAVGDTRAAWDAARMAQVVSNLVANALTHGAANAPVLVDVEGDEAAVRFRVANVGTPIPRDVLPRLFEPFRRGGDLETRPRGLGLGLYIAHEIVKAHGGVIHVESTVEAGTIFTVDVPRA